MGNTTDNRKLDEFVKNSLANYELPSSAPDWQKMEGMLGAGSKSASFNLGSANSIQLNGAKKMLSSYVSIIALMLAGGAYLTYVILKPQKEDNSAAESVINMADTSATGDNSAEPVLTEKTETQTVQETHPALADTSVLTTPIVEEKITKPESTVKETSEKVTNPSATKENGVKKEEKAPTNALEKKETKKESESTAKKEKKEIKSEKEPSAEKKKEKSNTEEKTKKETLKKSDNAIGLSNLLLQNIGAADTANKTKSAHPVQEKPDTTSH